MAKYLSAAFIAAALAPFASAQTYSSCNPLSATCPANPAIGAASQTIDFTTQKSMPDGWDFANTGGVTYDSNGANLILQKQGDSPILETTGYLLFGQLSVTMRAASGQGIVSSLVLLSDDLDEVDWEWTGTNTAQVQSNYFGKGDTTTYDRGAYHGVGTPQNTFRTYTLDWTPSTVTWSIDGATVRTLNYADAQGGSRFPQSPMKVRIGIWAGGDPTNSPGTIEWAGGATDYSKVPYSMSIKSVTVKNYSPAKSYTYGDKSGSYQSIKIDGGSLMASNGGENAPTTTGTKLSTSLSIASQIPTNSNNPLTAKATATSVANITNQTTLSHVASPTNTANPSSTANSAASALLRIDAAGMTSLSSLLFGVVALAFGFLA